MKRIASVAIILSATARLACALPQPSFYASYDEGFDADAAAGNPAGEVVGEPVLEPGKLGQAARVGRDLGQVTYQSAGNFDLHRGAIEMWVKAGDWRPADAVFCTFFGTTGFHVYKYNRAQMLFYMITEGAEHGSAAWVPIEDWDVERWQHVCVVWDRGDMSIYWNGEFAASTTGILPQTIDPTFHIGTGPDGFGGDAQTLIDEVRIYPRPLTRAEVRQAWLRLAVVETEAWANPRITVPEIDLAPVADGDLSDPAWDWAAGISGFVDHATGRLADGQPVVLLVAAADRLHLAWQAPLRDGRPPELQALMGDRERPLLHLSVAADGRGEAPLAGVVAAAGVAGDRWVGEMSIPLLPPGEQGPGLPTHGPASDPTRALLDANLTFRWPDAGACSWAYAVPADDPGRLGRVVVDSRALAARLLPMDWGDDSVRVGVELRGVDALRDADLRVWTWGPHAENELALQQPIGTLVGAHRRQVWLELPLGNPNAATMVLSVDGSGNDGAAWDGLTHCIPVDFRRSLDCELTYHRFDERLEVALRPAREDVLRRGTGGVVTIEPPGREPTLSIDLSPTPEGVFAGQADISALEPGRYVVRGSVTDVDGQVIAGVESAFTCEQDGWEWVRSLGQVEGVLPPWTPVEVGGTVARCWGREFDLDRGLPTGITSQGEELLAAPVALQATVGDERVDLTSAQAQLRSDGPVGADARATAEAAGLAVETNTRLEYDGLLRCQVTLTPEGQAEIAGLTLTIPLRSAHATLLNYTPVERDEPPVHEGEGSFAHGLPAGDGVAWSADFVPFVWIGDEDLGLSWMMEDDRVFEVAEGEPAVEIVRVGERTDLRITFNRAPRTLAEPLTIDFALQPTPVRPLPADWRSWRWISQTWDTLGGEDRHPDHRWHNISVYWWTLWGDIIGWPVARDHNAVAEYATYLRARDDLLVPYMQSGSVPTRVPEGRSYADEWCIMPRTTADQMVKCCPRSDFADFVVWACDHEVRHLGVPGVYIDLVGIRGCINEAHGCGYRRHGELRPTFPIYAARRMYQRLRGVFVQHGIEPLIVTSSRWKWPHYFYADSACSGEQFYHAINTDRLPYHEIVPLDQWRAEFLSPQFGNVSVFLPAWRDPAVYQRPDETQQMLALTLQHEVEVWPIWCAPGEVAATWAAKERFGMTPEVQFHPYWREQSLVTTDAADALIGVYSKPGATLAIVSDMSNTDREITLSADLAGLGLGPAARACDATTGEVLEVTDGELTVSVPARRFRMVLLR